MPNDETPPANPPDPALPPDLQRFRDSYGSLFGEMPPLPEAKFAFAGQVDPEGLRELEAVRAHVFYAPLLDPKTIQLMCFAVLLAQGVPAASEHAKAARRAGATWEELWFVCNLTAALQSLGPANQGGALLQKLRQSEENPAPAEPSQS